MHCSEAEAMPPSLAVLDFQDLFHALPDATLVVVSDVPRFTIAAVSDAYLAATHTSREIVGAPFFKVFPDNPDDHLATGVRNLTSSLLRVIESGVADTMPLQRYDIPSKRPCVGFQERYWIPRNSPYRARGDVPSHVIHRIEDVTTLVRAGQGAVAEARHVSRQHTVSLRSNADLPHLRQVLRLACKACELDELAMMDLLVVGSEIGREILAKGGSATVAVRELGLDLPRGLQLHFRKDGSNGHLDASSAEHALAVAMGHHSPRQLIDEIVEEIGPGGTALTLTKWKRRGRALQRC